MMLLGSMRKQMFTGLVLGGLLLSQALPAQAFLAVPNMKQQQARMATSLYYQSALQLARYGGLDISTNLIEKAYRLNPDDIEYGLTYGEFLRLQGRFEEALAVYGTMKSQFSDPLSQLLLNYHVSLVHEKKGNLQQAIQVMEEKLAPNEEMVPSGYFFRLGVLYARLGQYHLTRVYSEKTLQLSPDSAEAWNNLGYSLAKLGEFPAGYDAVKKSLELEPNNPNALDSMGYILFNMGKFEESIAEYEKAIQMDPKMADSFLYLGKSYEATQTWEKAVAAYEQFIALTDDLLQKNQVQSHLDALRLKVIQTNKPTQLIMPAQQPVFNQFSDKRQPLSQPMEPLPSGPKTGMLE